MKTSSMKQFAVTLIAASTVTLAPAFALGTAELQKVSKTVAAAKVVEMPSVASKAVSHAAKEDKQQVAVTAVLAAARTYPSSIGPVITAVVKAAPSVASAVVTAAVEAAPDSALTIVAAAVQGAPASSDVIVAAASAQIPARAAAFEREASVVRGRQSLGSAALITATGTKQIGIANGTAVKATTTNTPSRGGLYGVIAP